MYTPPSHLLSLLFWLSLRKEIKTDPQNKKKIRIELNYVLNHFLQAAT